MKRKAFGITALLVMLALSTMPFSTALADVPAGAKVQLTAPPDTAVGQDLTLKASVTDASGAPLRGIEVVFRASVSFLNTQDSIELGRAVSDAQGLASISYSPLSEGQMQVSVTPSADGSSSKRSATATVKVDAGPAQYVSEKTGIQVPGVGVWFLAALMGGIWAVFLWAITQLRAISRLGQVSQRSHGPGPGGRHVI